MRLSLKAWYTFESHYNTGLYNNMKLVLKYICVYFYSHRTFYDVCVRNFYVCTISLDFSLAG
uniref:Uncharacterized protein n=1 Tax=Anguilla anguilla TaxID=7936 RepID=A0A0E9P9W8_ANGAN